jgi:lambda family phage portal protein
MVRGARDASKRELAGLKRRNAFSGAVMNRLVLDWLATTKSPDQEIKGDLRRLRARARELARNNSLIKRYLRLLVANVLGHAGIKLQALVKTPQGDLDIATNSELERAWRLFAEGPVTIDEKYNLRQLEDLLLRTVATDGEVFVRIWRGSDVNSFGLAFQPIDADMVDERFNRSRGDGLNEIRLGVEVNKVGRPAAYHVWNRPGTVAAVSPRSRERVPADDILHLYHADRVNQTRGVTSFHSIMLPAHMLEGYEESEAVASRVASAKMGFLVRTNPEAGASVPVPGGDDDDSAPFSMQAAPGTIEELDEGVDFKPWDPVHPTGQFSAFVNQMVRKIASGLSVFANVLGNDASGVNYSSFRSFALIERDDWRHLQTSFIEIWRRPIYSEWIKLAILMVAVKLPTANPNDYSNVRHRARGWPWIDPQKEAAGAVLALENQLASRTSILAEKGIDFEDVLHEIEAETKLAASLGITLTTSSPKEEPATTAELEEVAEAAAGSNGDGRDAVLEAVQHNGVLQLPAS